MINEFRTRVVNMETGKVTTADSWLATNEKTPCIVVIIDQLEVQVPIRKVLKLLKEFKP